MRKFEKISSEDLDKVIRDIVVTPDNRRSVYPISTFTYELYQRGIEAELPEICESVTRLVAAKKLKIVVDESDDKIYQFGVTSFESTI